VCTWNGISILADDLLLMMRTNRNGSSKRTKSEKYEKNRTGNIVATGDDESQKVAQQLAQKWK